MGIESSFFPHDLRYSSKYMKMNDMFVQAQPETLQTVQSTIAKQLSIDETAVTPQTKFSDLGADSLDIVSSWFNLTAF